MRKEKIKMNIKQIIKPENIPKQCDIEP